MNGRIHAHRLTPYVMDSGHKTAGGVGLILESARDVMCTRHYVHDERAAGIWQVTAGCSGAEAEVRDWSLVCRPAVVDDYGSLVFVGEPR